MSDSEGQRLAKLRAYRILDTAPEASFDRITELAADLFDAPIALVSLVDEDRQWFKSAVGLAARETPRDQAFCAYTILSDAVLDVPDARADSRFCDNPLVLGDPDIRFYAGAPLRLASGERLGSLCVIDRAPRPPLTEVERRRLRALADIVVNEMELRLAGERLRAASREAQAARAELEAREILFRGLADAASDVVLQVDLENTILYASPSVARYGYAPEDLVGAPGLSLVHPDDRENVLSQISALRAGRPAAPARERAYRIRAAAGGYVWVEGSPSLQRDADGALTGLVTQLRDVTDRRAVEDALRASEARYRVLTENATDIIGCYGADAVFTYVSPAVHPVLGYRPEEIVGRRTTDVIHRDDIPRVLKTFTDYLAAGEGAEPVRIEYRAFRKDGAMVWLEAHPRAIWADGELVEFQDVVRDVTERKAVERELAAARDAAEAANAAKGEFLANMSHELRTPLTSIIGFAGILGAAPGLGERERRFAERIGVASNNLLAIVNDVLDLAALESGEVAAAAVAVDARAVVAGVVDMLAEPAAARGLYLAFDAAADLPPAWGDAARVRQIVLNLVGNALKFTEAGGVAVRLAREGEGLRLEVADTGIGIAADRIGQVFDRFVQADASISRRFGGTGLGLAISRRLVEQMGGEIWVDSVEGEGATFTVRLPGPPAEGPLREDRELEA